MGISMLWGFPHGTVVKNLPAIAGNTEMWVQSWVSRRSPGEGNSNMLQYSCLENPMDRGASWTIYSPWVQKELDTAEGLTLLLTF